MGTITLGLLIAIGLEQSVEWVHHREQRRQLIEDIREEAAVNAKRCEHYVKESMGPQVRLRDEWQQVIWSAPAQHGIVTVTVPQTLRDKEKDLQEDTGQLPVLSVWTIAKQSGLVPLLPPKTARFYDNLNYEMGLVESTESPLENADADYTALLRSVTGRAPRILLPQADVMTLTQEQRQEMLKDLAKVQSHEEFFVYVLRDLGTFSQGVADGVETGEEYWQWLKEHPGDRTH
ncbi:MAG: hypothetical protein PW792_05775 [Acidobacteriaceae bacterium]|nr:hypothetical protein [Acidobacteriaceae bacterium]